MDPCRSIPDVDRRPCGSSRNYWRFGDRGREGGKRVKQRLLGMRTLHLRQASAQGNATWTATRAAPAGQAQECAARKVHFRLVRVSNCVQAAPANRASCGALQDRYAANSCRASGQEGPYEQAHPLRRSPRANCVAEREKIGEEAAAHLIMDAGARLHGYSR